MNIFRQSLVRNSWAIYRNPAILNSTMGFSQYFRAKDKNDIYEYEQRKIRNKKYRGLIDLWKKPLEKKRIRQARIKEIQANLQPPQPEMEKFIVHNPALGIKTQVDSDGIFAVVKIDDRQFKVTNDCILIVDTKQEYEINQKITFEKVLLVGTETYTLLGRPLVNCCKVEGTIQSISKGEKVIVFKKKRRKQYKKSFGHRSSLTSIRINNIVHDLTTQILERAVPLE